MSASGTDHISDLPHHIRTNRALWERDSDHYDEQHVAELSGENALAWGLWRIPKRELNALGDVEDKDVLELGCGAARWSIALAQLGARPVGRLPSRVPRPCTPFAWR